MSLISRIMHVQSRASHFAPLPRTLTHYSIRLLASGDLLYVFYIASDKFDDVRCRQHRAHAITLRSRSDPRFRHSCTHEVTLSPWTLDAITQITSELRLGHL
jgi:hypothetical protein